MAGRNGPSDGRKRLSDRAAGPELPIPREVHDAVERSAALRRGLALLHRAPAEVVAAAIGVHAQAVEEARDRLERPHERRDLIRVFARALERRRVEPPAAAPPPARPRGLHDLIREAERREGGLDFLRRAPAETVAITFTVHPDLVQRARELLASRGHVHDAGDDA